MLICTVVTMTEKIPLFVIGLPKDEPANEILSSKFGGALEKTPTSVVSYY